MVKQKTHATKEVAKREHYFEAVGRRKTAIARVRIWKGAGEVEISVNGKNLTQYFPLKKLQEVVVSPLKALSEKMKGSAKVAGGGSHAQAEAIRLGISRALVLKEATARPRLKALGYLKRDPRMVERKKFGSRKARRPQQWRKR